MIGRRSNQPAGLSWRNAGTVVLVPGLTASLRLDVADGAADAVSFAITGVPDGWVMLDAVMHGSNGINVSLQLADLQAAEGTATLSASATIRAKRYECSIALILTRFVLLTPQDRVTEVICSSAIEAFRFRRALRRALAGTAIKVTTVGNPFLSRFDYWTRDAFSSGRYIAPGAGRAAIHSLRARAASSINPEPLDQACARLLRRRSIASIKIGQPRPDTRWAHWFGNIVVTPALDATPQGKFPYGRIIVGRQHGLSISEDLAAFLAAQSLQWPPVEIDTSWLYIGHADEVLCLVDTPRGIRALLASPATGLELIDQLAATPVADHAMANSRSGSRYTARRLAIDPDVRGENTAAAKAVDRIAEQLIKDCGISIDAIIRLPMMVHHGRSIWPNPVNGLALGGRYLAPDPKGPMLDGADPLRRMISALLDPAEIEVRFIDTSFPLHVGGGEIHCATNAI